MGPARGRLEALTTLRFLAAFAIVIHHSRATFIPAEWIAGLPLDGAVSFFFVLSGFILTYTYPELPTARDVGRFWLARFARLWPIHVATLILWTLTVGPQLRIHNPLVLAANTAMVHAWIPLPAYFFSGNGVSWSIATEWGFYAMFPFLIRSLRSNWPLKLFGAALVLYVLVRISSTLPDYSGDNPGPSNFGVLYFNPLARLFEFVLGMCIAVVWSAVRPKLGTNRLAWTVAELTAVSLLVIYVLYARDYIFSIIQQATSGTFIQYLVHADLMVCCAIIIFVMASGTGFVGKLLTGRVLVYLGEISFSIYMLHWIIITTLQKYPELLGLPVALKFSMMTACVIAASMLTYHLIERPARKALTSIPELISRREAAQRARATL